MKTLFLILVLQFSLWGQETNKALDAKKGGDAILSQVEQVIQTPALFNGSDSVQPATAACPQGVKAPVDSGLLGKILVPYDNSLFLRSDLPYFLGDSYVLKSSSERARQMIVP